MAVAATHDWTCMKRLPTHPSPAQTSRWWRRCRWSHREPPLRSVVPKRTEFCCLKAASISHKQRFEPKLQSPVSPPFAGAGVEHACLADGESISLSVPGSESCIGTSAPSNDSTYYFVFVRRSSLSLSLRLCLFRWPHESANSQQERIQISGV